MSAKTFYKHVHQPSYDAVLKMFGDVNLSFPKLWKSQVQTNNLNKKIPPSVEGFDVHFHTLLMLFDICRMWFESAAIATFQATYRENSVNKSEKVEQFQVASMMLFRIAADLKSIRILVLSNLDVQARGVSRGLSEAIDVLSYSFLDAEFCDQMIAENDVKPARHFWHRNMSKGKIRKKLKQFCIKSAPPIVPLFGIIKEDEELFGLSVHASYLSGFICMFPNAGMEHESANTAGVSVNSIKTLNFAIQRMLMTIIVAEKSQNFGMLITDNFDLENADEYKSILTSGMEIYPRILLLNHAAYENYSELLHELESVRDT